MFVFNLEDTPTAAEMTYFKPFPADHAIPEILFVYSRSAKKIVLISESKLLNVIKCGLRESGGKGRQNGSTSVT